MMWSIREDVLSVTLVGSVIRKIPPKSVAKEVLPVGKILMLISPRIKKCFLSEESLVRQFSRSDKNSNLSALRCNILLQLLSA